MTPPPNKSTTKSKSPKVDAQPRNNKTNKSQGAKSSTNENQKKEKKQKVLMQDTQAILQLAQTISDKASEKTQEKQKAEKVKWAKIESKQQKKQQQKKKEKKLLQSMIAEVKQDNSVETPKSSKRKKELDSDESPSSKKVRFSAGKTK